MITRNFERRGEGWGIAYPTTSDWKERMVVAHGEVLYYNSAGEARTAALQMIAAHLADGWREVGKAKTLGAKPTPLGEEYDEALALVIAADLPAKPDWQAVYGQLGQHVKSVTLRRRLLKAVQAAHQDQADEAERLARIKGIAQQLREQGLDRKLAKEAQELAMARVLAAQNKTPTGGTRQIDFSED